MSIDRHDPRLTTYALDQMSDEDRQTFENELASDQAAVSEVESIRRTASLLEQELGQGVPKALSPEQREQIREAAPRTVPAPSKDQVAPIPARSRRSRFTWLAAAAVLGTGGLALGVALTFGSRDHIEAINLASEGDREPRLAAAPAPATLEAPMKRYAKRPSEEAKVDEQVLEGTGRPDTETYDRIDETPFTRVADDPRSTFSIDVDTAGYSLVRRHLNDGHLPPPGAVRIEELINYFNYDYPEPNGNAPFSVSAEVSTAPWAPDHRLVRIGLKGQHVAAATRPPVNLVFLLDVSGSMASPDKLPLLKQGLQMLLTQLDEGDRLAIAVYAGASGLVLPSTAGNRKREILDALSRLEAGGSTNGGAGIQLAYQQAQSAFIQGGVNRVILATDGDFNVGTTNQSELIRLIEDKAKTGVFLSVLGFGSGNYKDSTLEKLADKGNGNYAYIDSASEARKVLVEQAAGTLITIAKDVKIQVELNPSRVEAFRLIGYENRALSHQDFADDQKDAGEIGADHTVTALYELIPRGQSVPGAPEGGMLRYQKPSRPTPASASAELMTVKLRYKAPEGSVSRELEFQVEDSGQEFDHASPDHRFAAAVASFGMVLRGSPNRGTSNYDTIIQMAEASAGDDRYRRELATLVRLARDLSR